MVTLAPIQQPSSITIGAEMLVPPRLEKEPILWEPVAKVTLYEIRADAQ